MNFKSEIELIGLEDIPIVKNDDDIANIIIESLKKMDLSLLDGDILVIAQSLISKSNGRIRNLNNISPSEKALEIFEIISPKSKSQGLPLKDPKLIQLILDESKEIIKAEHVLITETKHGFICADAGIDKSNIKGKEIVSLLPENPDQDAERIRKKLKKKTSKEIAVIISDSFGRSFRVGAVGTAIGVSGINPILDMRGKKDLFGYKLQTTITGQADSLASAAQLVMGESNEGIPVVLIRGYKFELNENATIKSILRKKEIDIFRDPINKKFINLMKSRRSYKLPFENKNVERKIIEDCIEIARWAPSAHNGQYWRYIVIERLELRERLINNMNQKLRNDLEKDGKSEDFIENKVTKSKKNYINAPILILLCLDTTDLEKYPDNERLENEFILGVQSISCSATYLLLAIEIKNLAACWYCAPLFAKDIIKKTLNLPESYIPMAFFAVGYPLKRIQAPHRKELHDIIYKLKV
ncbi:MAG: coenzyme F420-0:L-glutamate ligase [Candidatus Thorarchaeota archaeon]